MVDHSRAGTQVQLWFIQEWWIIQELEVNLLLVIDRSVFVSISDRRLCTLCLGRWAMPSVDDDLFIEQA
jgi:hypothetical protein